MSAWSIFVYGLVPIVVFVLLDLYANMTWAVAGAILFAAIDVLVTYFWFGYWDPGSIIALVLFVVLGWVTLKWKNAIFIKMQPSLLALVMSLLILYFQFFSEPLVYRYLPLLKEAFPPQMRPMLDNPQYLKAFSSSVGGLAVVFLIHALWMAYAAQRQSTKVWLAVRAFGFWVLFGIYLVGLTIVQTLLQMRP